MTHVDSSAALIGHTDKPALSYSKGAICVGTGAHCMPKARRNRAAPHISAHEPESSMGALARCKPQAADLLEEVCAPAQ